MKKLELRKLIREEIVREYSNSQNIEDVVVDFERAITKKLRDVNFKEIYTVDYEDNFITVNWDHYWDSTDHITQDDIDKIIKFGKRWLQNRDDYTNPYFYVGDYSIKL